MPCSCEGNILYCDIMHITKIPFCLNLSHHYGVIMDPKGDSLKMVHKTAHNQKHLAYIQPSRKTELDKLSKF